ncbi:CMGC protein kinase [Nannizzia gypsea CBS 118893]|uniref:CMGC protein kinase n=1 Tax=Arthroderma gypseum (strain ATCC MYA-4604 / CBS 118893) TaxID=535722 RepID=E5R3V0_ARTGP|nr:CMGC protein kinase [Nannizzia gypsea CBS 118893]EFQ98010.1 CMGC protein kinase [Nannizzia gypsea CBS 118893]
MLDDFDLEGPNGSHKCLVYELLGPNIPDTIDAHFPDGRLPGKLAKVIAKQSLIGLDSLHQHNIGHGDLHTRNLAFTMQSMDNVIEEGFTEMLGRPKIGYVRRSDGKDLEPGIPEYIVKPTSYRTHSWNSAQSIKIIDFGGSFLPTAVPQTLHTPLAVRAPEVIFQDRIDHRVDLWSMGCMMARDMGYNERRDGRATENTGPSLQEWLEEVYFEGQECPDLTRGDIVRLGQIIGKLLQFEPSARASVRQVLDDPWFNE